MTQCMPFQKVKTFRSEKYKAWVKEQDCCRCLAPADDPHHLIGIGNMGGTGTKAPDSMIMPMCRKCHNEIHAQPELWPDQWEHIARTIKKAFEAGVIEVV